MIELGDGNDNNDGDGDDDQITNMIINIFCLANPWNIKDKYM